MENMPAEQVMGSASIYGTLSLMAQCNDVQCCSHSTFILVVSNNDLEQKLNPKPFTLCKGVRQRRAVSVMSAACRLLNP
jgi:hypothetical protein